MFLKKVTGHLYRNKNDAGMLSCFQIFYTRIFSLYWENISTVDEAHN